MAERARRYQLRQPAHPDRSHLILENLDAGAEWRENVEPADRVELAVESWYGGDCQAAQIISLRVGLDIDCSTSSTPSQTMEYESILGAQVSVENCEETALLIGTALNGAKHLSCEVHYSNTMNSAVGKPPSVTAREFTVFSAGWVRQPGEEEENPWYETDYPEDMYEGDYPEGTELRESFRLFAEGGELRDEYEGAGCASARTPECANLILDNLDDWASWYETNS